MVQVALALALLGASPQKVMAEGELGSLTAKAVTSAQLPADAPTTFKAEADAPETADVEITRPAGDRLRSTERALKWTTSAGLLATGVLGTITAVNLPTLFGEGRCNTGDPWLRTYGCDRGLSTLHGTLAVVTLTSYTANGVLALATPGPVGNVTLGERPWHRALTWVHLAGMIIQPALGLISAYPQVIGIRDAVRMEDFKETARTVHAGLGYLTLASYVGTLAVEF